MPPPLLLLASLVALASALDNGLGKLPGLGWNSDYCVGCHKDNGFQNEKFVKEIADYMHTVPQAGAGGKTLQALGFKYINMDAGWDTKDRDAQGMLVPDPAEWPSGLQYSVDYVHALGLGFGLYGDRGTKDCAGLPGADGHEQDDADFFAQHQIDWYKEDSCYAPQDPPSALAQYARMRDALNRTGRPIWFALCGWQPFYASDPAGGTRLGNSARIGPDTGPTGWQSVMTNALNGAAVSRYAGPSAAGGYWNDGCLQLIPGLGYKWTPEQNMTNARHRSQFSMWCMLAMNILLTGNFSALDPYVLQTWSNAEVLALDQDPLGMAAVVLAQNASAARRASDLPAAKVAECGGEPELQRWDYNAPAARFLRNAASALCLNVDDCGSDVVYDFCNTNGTTCGGGHGAFHPNEQWNITADGSVRSLLPGSPCLTVLPSGLVDVLPCQSPLAPAQRWSYTPATGALVTGQGLCLTAPSKNPPPPSVTFGRPLSGQRFALLLLNNDPYPRSIYCNADCLTKLRMPAGVKFTVRDLWLHEDVARDVTVEAGVGAEVQGGGASVVLLLTPQ